MRLTQSALDATHRRLADLIVMGDSISGSIILADSPHHIVADLAAPRRKRALVAIGTGMPVQPVLCVLQRRAGIEMVWPRAVGIVALVENP